MREGKQICSLVGVIQGSARSLMKPVSIAPAPALVTSVFWRGQHTHRHMHAHAHVCTHTYTQRDTPAITGHTTFLQSGSNVITLPKHRMLLRPIRPTDLGCSLWHVTQGLDSRVVRFELTCKDELIITACGSGHRPSMPSSCLL